MKSRILFAAQPQLLAPLLQVIHRIIASFLIKQAGLKRTATNTGAITLIQRFGSAANLNIHPHCLVLDGVYRNSTAVFHEVAAPTLQELQALLAKITTRIIRWLTKQGFLTKSKTGPTSPKRIGKARFCPVSGLLHLPHRARATSGGRRC